jgi:hypothetical protein
MLRSRLGHAIVAVALLAAPPFLFGDRALAVEDEENKVRFGPIGIGAGEGARINVYTIGNPEVVGNPDIAPWTFLVRIFNPQGRVVQEGKLEVAVGTIGSFDIIGNPDTRTGTSVVAVRRTLRAEIVGFNPQPDPPGKFASTFEVYNPLNGRTSILLGGPDTLPAAILVPPPSVPDGGQK